MPELVFVRHFETAIDRDRPASEWTLSEEGREAMRTFLGRDAVRSSGLVYSSPEHKALITAERAGEIADTTVRVTDALREVDRSGEGFVDDPSTYAEMVELYFSRPDVPFDWENRRDVETRIRRFVGNIEVEHDPVLIVSHGMLFTTMLAPLSGRDRFEFWKGLEFGEMVRIDFRRLDDYW